MSADPRPWQPVDVDDIVAVEVKLDSGEGRFFMTWGRIQDTVDGSLVEAVVLRFASSCSLGGSPQSARLCTTLQEARDAPYFYEALFEFAREPGPFGRRYEAWRKKKAKAMDVGREIYYLGTP